MKAKWVTLLLAVGVLFAVFLSPRFSSALSNQGNPGRQTLIYDLQYQETNNVSMPITNFGQFGQNLAGSAGDDWPKGSGNTYIFGAGIWVGALLGNDTIVINGYNTVGSGQEFIPGPHTSPNRAEDRLFFSSSASDLAYWGDTTDAGEPIIIGDEDTWCMFNGHDPTVQGAGELPLPVTVTRHSFAWNNPLNANMIFFLYTIRNDTTVTLTDMYVGLGSDLDIGDADNDLVGLDVKRSLGYTFTPVQEAGWDAPPPYYIAYRMLQAPRADDTVYVGQDPANPDTIIYPGEHLVLTAFKKFTRNVDANNDIQRFLVMAGYDFNYLYGPFSDSADAEPSDKRMAMSSGPFTLDPGEIDTLLIAVMYSNGNTGGLKYLQSEGDAAKKLFDAGWAQPKPPRPPTITTLVPGSGRVVIGWDNLPVLTPDDYFKVTEAAGDTVYREYDFEGYRLWRSRTGIAGQWDLLAQFDIANGVTLLPDGTEDGLDMGLQFSYQDTTVYNGFTYHYAVTSYDYNTSGQPGDVTFYCQESGYSSYSVIPRSEVGNEMIDPDVSATKLSGSSDADDVMVRAIAPTSVADKTYELRWSEIMNEGGYPVFTYDIYDATLGTDVLTKLRVPVSESLDASSSKFYVASFTSAPFNGLVAEGTVTYQVGDSLGDWAGADSIRVTGSYDPSRVVVDGVIPGYEWAFHGDGRIEIRWAARGTDTLTATVWDVTNNAQIPFSSKLGDSWSFGPLSWGDEVNVDYITADNGPARTVLYICGAKYWLNSINGQPYPLEWSVRPSSGDVWTAYNSGSAVPCRGNVWRLTSGAPDFADGTESILTKIKVVPNPYIVRNDWEVSPDYSKIQFTNLPLECTIRIYTLAGDLIRTIHHEVSPNDLTQGGTEEWDVLTSQEQKPASGVYIYHISTNGFGTRTGKIAIIK
jgi:hypothetical protein